MKLNDLYNSDFHSTYTCNKVLKPEKHEHKYMSIRYERYKRWYISGACQDTYDAYDDISGDI